MSPEQNAKFNPVDVFAYVLSENVMRRHLTTGQRAMIAEKIAKRGSLYTPSQKEK